jgi:hypothetical protein
VHVVGTLGDEEEELSARMEKGISFVFSRGCNC